MFGGVKTFSPPPCYIRLIAFPFSAIQNAQPFKGKGADTARANYAAQRRTKFRESADPLMRQIKATHEHVENLAELRDTLLPQLISGQLRLPDGSLEVLG